MAADERRHAHALTLLQSEPEAGLLWAAHAGIRPAAIRSSTDYVRGQIQRAQAGGLDAIRALAIAADLENALIERQFSRPIASSSLALRQVMEMLASETAQHRDALEQALTAERAARGER